MDIERSSGGDCSMLLAGVATAVGARASTTITATAAAFNGTVTSTATVSVTGSSGGVAGGTITSISIIPGSQSVGAARPDNPIHRYWNDFLRSHS